VYSTGRGDPGRMVNTGSPFLRFTDKYFTQFAGFNQCFGSGLDPDSIRSVDLYPDPDSKFRSRSGFKIRIQIRKGKNYPKKLFFIEISCFEVLDVLFQGPNVSSVA
jgi:hypothetical protein